MQVTALAEALMHARRADGAISLEELKLRLSRAGLEEFARALGSLTRRVRVDRKNGPAPDDKHPWI